MKIFEIKPKWMSEMRFSWSDSQIWALFTVTAVCVATDMLGYPRMWRLSCHRFKSFCYCPFCCVPKCMRVFVSRERQPFEPLFL